MSKPPPMPPRLVAAIAALVAVLLGFNVVADVVVPDYQGYGTTFVLVGFLGGLLGIHRSIRGGDDE